VQWSVRLALVPVALAVVTTAAARPQPRLVLPYDLAVRGGSVYVADGLRHQVLRYDLATRRMSVVAGTGRVGTSGDGGPARRARLTEPTELVFDRVGNLYFSDVNQGRVRRIDRRGVITTVARVPAAAGLSVDPAGRYLAIASIEGWVYRLALLPAGRLERLAGDGSDASTGDGGPASAAKVNGPHDVSYDARGNLLVTEFSGVRVIDAGGRIDTLFRRPAFKVVPAADGTFYVLAGSPNGGTVTQVERSGRVLRVIGTGRLGPHADRVAINRVGFLPSDVEFAGGALLVTQTQPVPAIRRLARGSRTLTTLVR
jgi:hypothetical protein